ncbi:hypothetical protein [Photobacterium chitinilyticum]|uniref:Uncharacterized protein n=1 Tax=Photobacterium chitinilyticum TaxID=2485123 RepID=A0A444JQB9_9GAMM|nr:hypothetical protein [Photobacterium chitinilyticum]RWX55300.1 hypothetical protein EDI28_12100 [Photobacterium chitinilyticum]
MRLTGLNFDEIPRLDVPLRFYLTAPFFAVVVSLLLIWQGDYIWLGRWMPASLAITHLVAIGMMAMIMIGSLFQIMPVLCGAPIKIPPLPLILMQAGLIFGTLALSAGFFGWPTFGGSFLLLALSLGYFIVSLLRVLIFKAAGQQTRMPIMLAAIALGFVLLAGLLLLAGYLWGYYPVPGKNLTHLHAGTGIFGWVLLLIMAVSFQVIPMFHVTPEFPRYWRIALPVMLVIGLVSIVVATLVQVSFYFSSALIAGVGILYSIIGLSRLRARKRKLPDVVVSYWQWAYSCLILGCLLMIAMPIIPLPLQGKAEVFIALTIGMGFVLGVIQGMLLKIVPFLISLHLQPIAMANPNAMMLLPDHYSLISRKQMKIQFWLYLLGMVSIVVSLCYPPATASIGLVMLLNWLWIGYNILTASSMFYNVRKQMLAS